VPEAMVPVVGTDFLDVMFLTDALHSVGQRLLGIQQFLAANPNTDPGNHDFLKLQSDLAKHLAQVAQHATEDFGGPWGFNSMAILQRSATQKWLLVNGYVAGALETAKPLAAAAQT
jgi:hypothetical protein